MKKYATIAVLFSGILVLAQLLESCRKKDNAVAAPTPVAFTVPEGFGTPAYDFTANPLTQEGIELGRHLFYEGKLSRDGSFPCASCHQQFAAFATFDHDLSHGVDNAFTTRNAPGLFNLAWQASFHHDGGINNLEVQPLAPITAPNEMGETVENVIQKLKADAKYVALFQKAFGDPTVNSQRMLKALAQFSLTLVSANAKYDRVRRGEAAFSVQERAGYVLFQRHCGTCHKEPLFTDHAFRNNGLALNPFLKDAGRMKVTGNPADSLKFRVPSLRNLQLTAPYMHDGRFVSIEQCLEHYRSGIEYSSTLAPELENGIPLSATDIIFLTTFLKTLTDSAFIQNPQFSAPR